jgi:hypothetical protein
LAFLVIKTWFSGPIRIAERKKLTFFPLQFLDNLPWFGSCSNEFFIPDGSNYTLTCWDQSAKKASIAYEKETLFANMKTKLMVEKDQVSCV